MSQLRTVIKQADPVAVEEVKWKKPSNPMGVPVWSHEGILCIADTLKNAVRLTFPKGAQVKDPKKLFNTRLESNMVRAIDFHERIVRRQALFPQKLCPGAASKGELCSNAGTNVVNRCMRSWDKKLGREL